MHRTVFEFLTWREKIRAFFVCRYWYQTLRNHTAHLIVDSHLNKLIHTFPNILYLNITYDPDFYEDLSKLRNLKSVVWGGTQDNRFTNCPKRLLRELASLPNLEIVHIHDKTGSCTTCTERYGQLTQIKSLIVQRTTGFYNGIRKNICSLKNLLHLTLEDCNFDTYDLSLIHI
eukprot:TRINITY_DN8082_c0_g1_i1.p1 TRINITY_DN8082_c0_g1~~TRINITY_DN8082_c0_g1_i1.p1  ORF type:complete len:173 (-),score=14.52 TRINITY_DN8082_c0_g1_i1:12-530(-)